MWQLLCKSQKTPKTHGKHCTNIFRDSYLHKDLYLKVSFMK